MLYSESKYVQSVFHKKLQLQKTLNILHESCMILLWFFSFFLHFAIFLELSGCSCIEKNIQPNISICAVQNKDNFTSFSNVKISKCVNYSFEDFTVQI